MCLLMNEKYRNIMQDYRDISADIRFIGWVNAI